MGFVSRLLRAVVFKVALAVCVMLALGAIKAGFAQETLRALPSLETLVSAASSALGAGAPAQRGAFQASAAAVAVDDGDTIKVLTSTASHLTVRLASIDAPEASHTGQQAGRIGQPFGQTSRRHLASLVLGKTLKLDCFETDRFGRAVCNVQAGEVFVNREMVAVGLAWSNQGSGGRYLRDRSLLAVEARARDQRLGLWADKQPVAPWVWRTSCWNEGLCPSAH